MTEGKDYVPSISTHTDIGHVVADERAHSQLQPALDGHTQQRKVVAERNIIHSIAPSASVPLWIWNRKGGVHYREADSLRGQMTREWCHKRKSSTIVRTRLKTIMAPGSFAVLKDSTKVITLFQIFLHFHCVSMRSNVY